MSGTAKQANAVLTLAPIGRDAEVACGLLSQAGIPCRPGRDFAEFYKTPLEDLSALVLTEELLTRDVVERLSELLNAQTFWSNLPVILLVDPDHRRTASGAEDHWISLSVRPGIVMLQRPMSKAVFVSIVRAALESRQRQFHLRDELEARKIAEARAQTLAGEMKHRVKNTFALASSIASQTFREAETLDDAREAFSGRLASMARAQDLIMGSGDDMVEFRQLVEQATDPYRSVKEPEPFCLEGPQILVTAEKATAFAMAFHELATNAAKYGALSAASGRVAVRWWAEAGSDARGLIVEWRERGGPPVSPPQRQGFGSRLIERALARDLGGSAELVFDPEGVVCTIHAVLTDDER